MKWKRSKKIAATLILSIIFQGFPNLAPGEFTVEMGEVVENVAAAEEEDSSPVYMTYNSNPLTSGEIIEMKAATAVIGVAMESGWPAGTKVEWTSYNENVLRVETDSSSPYAADITAIAPGYSNLMAVVNVDGTEYRVRHQIHIPVKLADTSEDGQINFADDNSYGMVATQEEGNKIGTIRLSTEAGSGNPTHFLPIFQYVNYAQGINSVSGADSSIFANGIRMGDVWEWSSSDESIVTVDARTGLITAVGSGYTTVKVRTKTTDLNGEREEKELGILVSPAVTGVSGAKKEDNGMYYSTGYGSITFQTNVAPADDLNWSLTRDDGKGETETLDKSQNDYITVNTDANENSISLSNAIAGVYYLTAKLKDSPENIEGDTIIIPLVVEPYVIETSDLEEWEEAEKKYPSAGRYFIANSNRVSFRVNMPTPDSLEWKLYRNGNELGDIVGNGYMAVEPDNAVNEIVLSGLRPGVYKLEGTVKDNNNQNFSGKLEFKIVVPLTISENKFIMNAVDGNYNVFNGSNILDKGPFHSFSVKNEQGSTVQGTLAGVQEDGEKKGEVTAISEGNGYVEFEYNGADFSDNFLKKADFVNRIYKEVYKIPFEVLGEPKDEPWPEKPNFTFYLVYNSQVIGENSSKVVMPSDKITILVKNTSGIWPTGAWVDWWGADKEPEENIIKIDGNSYTAEITAVGPGSAMLHPVVNYNGDIYEIPDCTIQVPLKLVVGREKEQINFRYDNWYGMIDQINAAQEGDTTHKTIQLSMEEGTNLPMHYLPIFQYVNYAPGINSISDVGDTPERVFAEGTQLAWEWSSNDETIATVDSKTGFITAKGAGFTKVVVRTSDDEFAIDILVAPCVERAENASWNDWGEKGYYMADSPNMAFYLNTEDASKLNWELYRNSLLGDAIKLEKVENITKYMTVTIGQDKVSLSQVAAGVYYLVARPNKDYTLKAAKVNNLVIKIIVPLMISEDEVIMNVGDEYDLGFNMNIPNKNQFSYEPPRSIADIKEVDGKYVLVATHEGEGFLIMRYTGEDKDSLRDEETNITLYKDEYKIPLTVIDKISIAGKRTIYIGDSPITLILEEYNPAFPPVWSVDDTSIVSIKGKDDAVEITPLNKEGIAYVTATQIVNGVTKKVTFEITVRSRAAKYELNKTELRMVLTNPPDSEQLHTKKPDSEAVYWEFDESIVSLIDDDGKVVDKNKPYKNVNVTPRKAGTTVITVLNENKVPVGSCLVIVTEPAPTEAPIKTGTIRFAQTSVTVPLASKNYMLEVLPKNYIDEVSKDDRLEIRWSSDKPSYATVQNGLVTLKKATKEGEPVIISCGVYEKATGRPVTKDATCSFTITPSTTGIKLNQTSVTLAVGDIPVPIPYEVTPKGVKTDVTCTSTNTPVATARAMNGNIVITPKSVGQTIIIVRTVDGGYIATCAVTVEQAPRGVKLDANALTLNVGDYYNLEAVITPANSTDTSLSWESSDKKVAVVSNKGKVTGKSIGIAIILVRTKNGASAYCTVNVQQGVTGVKLDSREETIYVGDEISLDATVSPKSASMTDVKWSSSNTSVARVNADGEITGISAGVAIITCTTVDGGYTDYCVINVERPEVEVSDITLSLEECMIGVGETQRLTATVMPADATNPELVWSSSDTDIVTVDQRGRIKGIAPGTATITCEAADGSGADAYCEVEVYTQITNISLSSNYLDMIVGDSETLTAEIVPSDATYGIYWESEDPSIAIVNRTTGRVTALKAGDTTITAKADDNSGMNTICFVHVKNPVATTNIQVSESEIVMIPGETKSVSFTILPAGHTDSYVWSSDNPVVASVDARTGLITAHSMGTSNITIFADSGRSASVKVYVVGLSKTTLNLQQYTSTIISLEVFGASKSDLDVRWYSENERIAEVANGKITGRAIGTTYIYAVVNGRNLACRVTVEKIRNN